MSNEPPRATVRLVPMTHADISWLWEGCPQEGKRRETLERLSAAFNAAPNVPKPDAS